MNNLEQLCVIIDRDYRRKKIFHGQMTEEYVTFTDSKIEIRPCGQTIEITNDIMLGKDLKSCQGICDSTDYVTIDTLFMYDLYTLAKTIIEKKIGINVLNTFGNQVNTDLLTIIDAITSTSHRKDYPNSKFTNIIFNTFKYYESINFFNIMTMNKILQNIMINNKLNKYNTPHKLMGNIFINDKYIYKAFPDCDIGKRSLNIEYEIYNHMNKLCDNFNSFDTMTSLQCFSHDNVLRGIFNTDMVNFGLMVAYKYTNIVPLLNIIDTILRPNNFFHGDFKENNIIFNAITNNIQIIDLEYSRILQDETIITDNDLCLSYYIWDYKNPDKTNGLSRTFGKRYLFFYDMFKLVATIFNKHFIETFNKLFEDSISDTYLDFLLIYNIFITIDKYTHITPCRYMNDTIKNSKIVLNEKLQVHYDYIVELIDHEFACEKIEE
jgi:hypothetical protein